MADDKRDERAPQQQVPDNSDPTGIGPPPPGAETHVENGRGVTEGPPLGKEADTKETARTAR